MLVHDCRMLRSSSGLYTRVLGRSIRFYYFVCATRVLFIAPGFSPAPLHCVWRRSCDRRRGAMRLTRAPRAPESIHERASPGRRPRASWPTGGGARRAARKLPFSSSKFEVRNSKFEIRNSKFDERKRAKEQLDDDHR